VGGAWPGSLAEAFSPDTHCEHDSPLRALGRIQETSHRSWIRDFESVIDAAEFQHSNLRRAHGAVASSTREHPERVRKLFLYGTYSLGRVLRHNPPVETEKTVGGLSLRLAGARQCLLQIWAHAFQPEGTIEHGIVVPTFIALPTSAKTRTSMVEIG